MYIRKHVADFYFCWTLFLGLNRIEDKLNTHLVATVKSVLESSGSVSQITSVLETELERKVGSLLELPISQSSISKRIGKEIDLHVPYIVQKVKLRTVTIWIPDYTPISVQYSPFTLTNIILLHNNPIQTHEHEAWSVTQPPMYAPTCYTSVKITPILQR